MLLSREICVEESGAVNEVRARQIMDQNGIDCIVATSVENIYYVTGLALGFVRIPNLNTYAIFPRDPDAGITLVCPHKHLIWLPQQSVRVERVVTYGRFVLNTGDLNAAVPEGLQHLRHLLDQETFEGKHTEALALELERLGLDAGRIGLDDMGLTHPVGEAIRERLPRAAVMDASTLFRKIRTVKTPAEVQTLRDAAEINGRAFEEAAVAIRPGITHREIIQICRSSICRMGATPVNIYLTAGPYSCMPFAVPTDYVVQPGDLVRFDLSMIYNMYYSDIARTVVVGEPRDSRCELYHDAVATGTKAMLEAMRPGVRVADLFDLGVRVVRESGIPNFDRHHCGHGVGIEPNDNPSIIPGGDAVLEPGMVVNIETPYYEIGFGGVAVEDTVLVTDSGTECFTDFLPRTLRRCV